MPKSSTDVALAPSAAAALFDQTVRGIENGTPMGFAAEAKLASRRAKAAAANATEQHHSIRWQSSPRNKKAPSPRASAPAKPTGGLHFTHMANREVDSRDRKAESTRTAAMEALDNVESLSYGQLARRAVGLSSPRKRSTMPSPRDKPIFPSASVRLDNPMFFSLLEAAAAEVPRREASLGPEHPATLERVYRYGILLHQAGRHEEGKEQLARVANVRRRLLGVGHAKVVEVRTKQAEMEELERVHKAEAEAAAIAAASEEDAQEEPRVLTELENHPRVLAEILSTAVLPPEAEQAAEREPHQEEEPAPV